MENPAMGGASEETVLMAGDVLDDSLTQSLLQIKYLTARFALPPPTARAVAFLAFGEDAR